MSVWEPVGTSFIEEVDVFNQEAEERDNNLKGKKWTQDYITAITDQKKKKTCNQMEQPHWSPSKGYRHSKTALGSSFYNSF